jgi:hypothetical protein
LGIVDSEDRIGTAPSGVLGLGQNVVLNIARLVPAADVGNSGMVDPLRRVPQRLARGRVPRGVVVIHHGRANKRRLNASLIAKAIK